MTPAQQLLLLNRLCPEVKALLAAYISAPSQTYINALNRMVVGLKAAGIWSRLDVFAVHATNTAYNGCVSASNPTKVFTQTNAPTFTAYKGFTGDGVTAHLDYPNNLSTLVSQDDTTMFVYCLTNVSGGTNAGDIGGVGSQGTSLNSRISGSMGVRSNATTADLVVLPSATSIGLSAWSRDNSANFSPYKDGVALGTTTQASTGVSSGRLGVLRQAGGYSSRQIAISGVGQSLTASQHASLYTLTNAFLTAIGAI